MGNKKFVLPVEIEALEEGGYLATCSLIQGCMAEGETIPQALEYIEDVARVLLELMKEDGKPIPEALKQRMQEQQLHAEILVSVDA